MKSSNQFSLAIGTAVLIAATLSGPAVCRGQVKQDSQPPRPPADWLVAATAPNGQKTESVRPAGSRKVRTSVAGLLGWSVGLPSEVYEQLTFTEAAVKADALGLAFIEGYDTQKASPDVQKNLDYNLTPDEVTTVSNKLHALNMKMLSYHVAHLGNDEGAQRQVLSFAKSLGAATVTCSPDASALAGLDKVANEVGINVAVEGKDPKTEMSMIEGRSSRIGVSADTGSWAKTGIPPAEAFQQVKDRLMVLTLRDGGVSGISLNGNGAAMTQFLLDISKAEPAPEEQPDKCTNCSRPYGGIRPLFIAIRPPQGGDATAHLTGMIDAFEKDVRPAMGYRVEEDSKLIPTTSTDRIPADVKEKIEAALPKEPLAKPKKPRKLLVIDICPAGAYYHDTAAHANYALQLMAKNTGAFEPIFSNDLDNLKYPKIKEYDAVFLNSSDGQLFADPEVMAGLKRFVREGGGLAGLHGASFASMDVPEFAELLGAGDGPHHVEHAVLKIDDPNSPLMKKFDGKDFEYVDEFYHFPPTGPYSREKLHVLLSIDAAKSDLSMWHVRPDNDYGLVWVRSYGKGRVFNCALGHTPTLFERPDFAEMIFGGIQFVLGDLQVDTTPSAKLTAQK
ncbi:MAG TPA: ThuA domain-containing protein [Acidobacteriaceae bacterium]|nr:ThuA domain-containing protein [Acidobacteriaceae bacterium]